MSKDAIEGWAYIAWTMAWITVVASLILGVVYGQAEVVRHTIIGPRTEAVTNWPLIVGLVASSIYAFLFAVIMSALHRSVSLGEEVLDELRAMRAGEAAQVEPESPAE